MTINLRPSTLAAIQAALAELEYFEASDFSIETEWDSDEMGTMIVAVYLPQPEMRFVVSLHEHPATGARNVVSWPGDMLPRQEESTTAPGLAGLFHALTDWTERIQEDIAAQPLQRAVRRQQEEIDEMLARIEGLTDEMFTAGEQSAWRKKLQELEATLADRIRGLHEEGEAREARLSALEGQVAALSASLAVATKKSWVRMFMSRFLTSLNEPAVRALLESSWESVKQLTDGSAS